MNAKQLAAFALVAAAFAPVCGAQVTSPNQVTTSAKLRVVGIAPVRDLSAGAIIPALVAGIKAVPGIGRVDVMRTIGQASVATPRDNGIPYQGGPIIDDANGVNVYYIWYGDWSKDTAAQTILTDFIKNLGGSPYFNINTTYYDYEVGPNGTNVVKDLVVNSVHYMGSTNDNYSLGKRLSDNDVGLVAQNAILDGRLPLDYNGVYFVITSADVTETSGFCTAYCAFHGYQGSGPFPNQVVAFIGNIDQCPSVCTAQPALPTPNNNVGADGMVSAIAHELEESVTDPLATSWTFPDQTENADLCAFTYGAFYRIPNGSYANMKLGDHQYLIQQNWVNKNGGYCALRWDD